MAEKIECEICGDSCHSMKVHLRDFHGESNATTMTEEEYQSKYPEALMNSPEAQSRIDALREKKTAQQASAPKPNILGKNQKTESLAKLFSLGRAKAARTTSGKDIPIEICTQTGDEDYIPQVDPNYVYPIETLKTVCMAFGFSLNCYLYGHSGVGKSTLFEQVCAATRRRMIRFQHTINTEESHIVGHYIVKKFVAEDGSLHSEMKYKFGPLATCMMKGWVYMADEYDRSDPSVLSVYNAVLEGKALLIPEAPEEFRVIRPHKDFRFCATGNTNGSGDETGLYQATTLQDAATIERFAIVEKVGYMSEKHEAAVVRQQAKVIEADALKIVQFCHEIRKSYPTTISLTIGPRVAINIGRIGMMRGSLKRGVELAFANRLPESEYDAAMSFAQRIFG